MNLDDARIFFAITKDVDTESGQHINTQQAIRRKYVSSWRPGHLRLDTTVVKMVGGETFILDHKFSEFHAWIMAPAFEQDRKLRESGLKKSPGRPRTKKDETPAEEDDNG